MGIERRFCYQGRRVNVESRADGKPVLVGYAAVFYRADDPATQYEIVPGVVERIMPTAFDAALRERDDVRGLFNHDSNKLLGRLEAGTVRLSVDNVGLRYEIDPPDSPTGNDVVASVKRNDVPGSSFGFFVYSGKRGKVVWAEEKQADGRMLDIREIHDCELVDVGPVTFPAYGGTSAGVRSAADESDVVRERDAWRSAQRMPSDVEMDLLSQSARALVRP